MIGDRVTGDAEVARLYGFSPESMATGICVALMLRQVHIADRPRIVRAIRTAILEGGLYQERYRVTPDGIRFHSVLSVGRCFGLPDGPPVLWAGFICEVSAPDRFAPARTSSADNVLEFRR